MNVTHDEFLDLKSKLAEQLPAGQVSAEDAAAQLVAAGWEESLAWDFVGFTLSGSAE